MSRTDTTTSPASEPEVEKPRGLLDLSVTQVVGGALAAMTAAALGSRLSVAGTVVGAALASIIAAVAGALYTASLRHTRDKVRSVWTGTTGGTPTRVEVVEEAPPPRTSIWRSRRLWKRILIGALATFALAAGLVTGLELVSGQALSGGSGTTIERVQEPRTGGSDSDEREPSESPSTEPSDEATQPSEETSESTDPDVTPSADSTTEPSPQPSDGETTQGTDPSTDATESAPTETAPTESAPAEGDPGTGGAE